MIDREPFVCGLRTRIETYRARTYEHEHILIATTLRTVQNNAKQRIWEVLKAQVTFRIL